MTRSAPRASATSVTSPDPRIVRTRARVLAAAEELLVEGGPAAVTVEAVTARSGVAKTTIYRQWATHEALIAALLLNVVPELATPAADLAAGPTIRALCHEIATAVSDPRWQRLLPAVLLLKLRSDAVSKVEDEMNSRIVAAVGGTIERLVERGELELHGSLDDTMALLLGPLILARLGPRGGPSSELADLTADQFLALHLVRERPIRRSRRPAAPGSPDP